jgi:hypothetical protein
MTFDPVAMLAEIQADLDAMQRSMAHLAGLERAVIAFLDDHPQPVPAPAPIQAPVLPADLVKPAPAVTAAVRPEQVDTFTVPATKPSPKAPSKAETAPRPATTGPSTRRTRPPDDEVLAVIATAKADRRPIAQAVADHYAVKITTANNWITQARKAMPSTTPTPSPSPSSSTPEPVTIGATTDLAADLTRKTRPTATNQARSGSMVLMCDACEFETTADRAPDLLRHTLSTHGRRATEGERTPVRAREAS